MKKAFSTKWSSSKQPRKQRKYRYNAPLHIRHKFMSAHLSEELRKKYGLRALPVRVGDEVKVLRGQFKGKKAKIEKLILTDSKVYLSKIETIKKDGTKTTYPIDPSNIIIVSLNEEDKRRLKRKIAPKKEETKKNG